MERPERVRVRDRRALGEVAVHPVERAPAGRLDVRVLEAEDFNDDKKDAGEIGAGHSVTALYELVPAGQEVAGESVDVLKYQTSQASASAQQTEAMTVKIRYKAPDGDVSRLSTPNLSPPRA